MQNQTELSFFTLLLMVSFASINAVLFTPALPDITSFFSINDSLAQQTITWFLIGYTVGQLVYGPLANRYGRKKALYAGIFSQIISCFFCIFAGMEHQFTLLIIGRFIMAMGSGVGLKMAYTLISDSYDTKTATQKTSYLMLAFAITPALSVAIGGILNMHFGWQSCFYMCALYGVLLFYLVTKLPETKITLDADALKIKNIYQGYLVQFRNLHLIFGSLLLGSRTTFVYVFSTLTPFIAINIFHMNSQEYGMANLLPSIGLILGSLISARLAHKYSNEIIAQLGIVLSVIGTITMLGLMYLNLPAWVMIFLPMILIYWGSAMVSVASVTVMSQVQDKSNGSAVMNFINMGVPTLVVLTLSLFQITQFLLPLIFAGVCLIMMSLIVGLVSLNKLPS